MVVSDVDRSKFSELLRKLELAWNAGDGTAFGAPMTEDADFVTIRADHLHGREAIVDSHLGIFSTIYAGSRNQIILDSVRQLSKTVALVHARSILEAPAGPLVGRHESTFSTVMLRADGEWQITSFHITLAPERAA